MSYININSLCLQYATYCSYKKFSIEELYRKNKIEWDNKIKSEHLKILEKSKNDFIVRNDTIEVVTNENIDKINGTSDALYKIELQQRVDVSLVERLIRFFDQKFNIKFMHFHELENAICIFTSSQLFTKVSIMIKNSLSNAVHKRLRMFTNEMLNMKNLKNVLETNIEDLNALSSFQVIATKNGNLEPGVYLSYFQNCPDLDSSGDSIFNRIIHYMDANVTFGDINITAYKNILSTSKWKEFEIQDLSDFVNSGLFSYGIVNRHKECIMFILGETTLATHLKDKLNNFFIENKLLTFYASQDYISNILAHVNSDIAVNNIFLTTHEERVLSDSANNISDFKLIPLDSSCCEYQRVYIEFIEAFKNKDNFEINQNCKIEKVQNEHLQKQYIAHKDFIRRKNGHENEKFLYHGTQEDSVNSICKYGFNRSYCGVNGTKYGKGVYFAKYSYYANDYAISPNSELRKMFYCDVLVGECTPGSADMTVPPKKSNNEPYDSTSGEDDTVFVVYNDNQCYPRYLITYSYKPLETKES